MKKLDEILKLQEIKKNLRADLEREYKNRMWVHTELVAFRKQNRANVPKGTKTEIETMEQVNRYEEFGYITSIQEHLKKEENIKKKIENINAELENLLDKSEQPTEPQPITIPDNILQALQEQGFIEDATAQPLKWIKSNRTTHGKITNKKSLLDLLCLLGYEDHVIKNRALLNSLFIFSNGKPLIPQNYTYITDKNGNLKRPIVSAYHKELKNIIESNQ
ncbi:MAG: hypothetical protein LBF08_05085 [Dysgonamonadaceae bacterium]|jgi:hypothetical protein|nr:hypothetical protein [Dysgonamonadaceae bacterium]